MLACTSVWLCICLSCHPPGRLPRPHLLLSKRWGPLLPKLPRNVTSTLASVPAPLAAHKSMTADAMVREVRDRSERSEAGQRSQKPAREVRDRGMTSRSRATQAGTVEQMVDLIHFNLCPSAAGQLPCKHAATPCKALAYPR